MKKTWNTPKLTVLGSVEGITQAKDIGPSDGFIAVSIDGTAVTISGTFTAP